MKNDCAFSPCRKFRYTLEHVWDELSQPRRRIMWIGLNPSTADEQQLDPTLRRVRGFSVEWGYHSFVMTNLFAFRATVPTDMKAAPDPIGPENFAHLEKIATRCDTIVAAWGTHGDFMRQGERVAAFLRGLEREVHCLGVTQEGYPKHPLYVRGTTRLQPYK